MKKTTKTKKSSYSTPQPFLYSSSPSPPRPIFPSFKHIPVLLPSKFPEITIKKRKTPSSSSSSSSSSVLPSSFLGSLFAKYGLPLSIPVSNPSTPATPSSSSSYSSSPPYSVQNVPKVTLSIPSLPIPPSLSRPQNEKLEPLWDKRLLGPELDKHGITHLNILFNRPLTHISTPEYQFMSNMSRLYMYHEDEETKKLPKNFVVFPNAKTQDFILEILDVVDPQKGKRRMSINKLIASSVGEFEKNDYKEGGVCKDEIEIIKTFGTVSDAYAWATQALTKLYMVLNSPEVYLWKSKKWFLVMDIDDTILSQIPVAAAKANMTADHSKTFLEQKERIKRLPGALRLYVKALSLGILPVFITARTYRKRDDFEYTKNQIASLGFHSFYRLYLMPQNYIPQAGPDYDVNITRQVALFKYHARSQLLHDHPSGIILMNVGDQFSDHGAEHRGFPVENCYKEIQNNNIFAFYHNHDPSQINIKLPHFYST